MIQSVSCLVPPAWLQLEVGVTSHPCGSRLRNVKFPPPSESLSYQNAQTAPIDGLPAGGREQAPGLNRSLSTIGTGLLLPSPQLAVAAVVTGDS